MSQPWVLRMPKAEAACLGQLRRQPTLAVCQQSDHIWLRGEADQLPAAVLGLPGRRYQVRDDGQLVAAGAIVPSGRLPDGPWTELDEWISVVAAPAVFGGQVTAQVPLRLVRGGEPAEANLLLTGCDTWRDYAVAAPQIRLDRWSFAVNARRQVVVRGAPLPPLPGERFVERSAVAVPAGWTWSPPVDVATIRAALHLPPQDLALFQIDGSWHHLRSDDFVRATRSAVRLSDPDQAGAQPAEAERT